MSAVLLSAMDRHLVIGSCVFFFPNVNQSVYRRGVSCEGLRKPKDINDEPCQMLYLSVRIIDAFIYGSHGHYIVSHSIYKCNVC